MTMPSDPLALLRSRSYVALLVLAVIIGVPVSAAAYFFLALVSKLQGSRILHRPGGIAPSHLQALPLVGGIAMGIGAMSVVMLKLPLTSVLLASLLLASDGLAVNALVIVAVVVAYVLSAGFTPSLAPAAAPRAAATAAPVTPARSPGHPARL